MFDIHLLPLGYDHRGTIIGLDKVQTIGSDIVCLSSNSVLIECGHMLGTPG